MGKLTSGKKSRKKARKIGLLELTFYVFSRILNLQIHAHIYRSFIRHHKMLGVRIAKRKIEPQKPANPCDTRLCSCIFSVNTRHDGAKIPLPRRFFAEKRPARFGKVEETCGSGGGILCRKGPVARARLGRYFASFVKHRTVVVISPITAKMPSIPCPVMSSAISRFVIVRSSLP